MTSTPGLDVVQPQAGGSAVELRGELDIATAGGLAAVPQIVQGGVVLLDLRDLTFIDARGYRALVALRRELAADGRWLFIERPPPQVRQVVELCERLEGEQRRSFGVTE